VPPDENGRSDVEKVSMSMPYFVLLWEGGMCQGDLPNPMSLCSCLLEGRGSPFIETAYSAFSSFAAFWLVY
jgi:hypothetical protein